MLGVNCEVLPRQVNFLADGAGECGKGANNVIRQLSFFLETHGLGETVVFLHANNCTAQNKKNCMLQYLAWRALTNHHTSPHRTKIGNLKGIAQAVNDSAECNFTQLVCNQDGSTIVPNYDWTDFFAPQLKKITGIKKYHHFQCDSSKLGRVYVKENAGTVEVEINLMKYSPRWSPDPKELPSVVPPKGLSAERQWYLYDSIHPFCPDGVKDNTCPLPDVPKPGSAPGSPTQSTQLSVDDDHEPPPKHKRLCGTYRQEGHNSLSSLTLLLSC